MSKLQANEKIAATKAPGRAYGVLVTFRRPEALAVSLERLAHQQRPFDGIIVVDNASSDATRAVVQSFATRLPLEYFASGENLGCAGGIGQGMDIILRSASDDDWVMPLDDDDPLPDARCLGDLEQFGATMLARDPLTAGVGLIGGRFDDRRGCIVRVPDHELTGPVSVDFLATGHGGMYRASALRTAGVFSSAIFFGLSEVEFGLRVRRAGLNLYADGASWEGRRRDAGRLDLDYRPSAALDEPNWRRYYSLRNTIYILRERGRPGAAVRISLLRGALKPLVNVPRHPVRAFRYLRLNSKAVFHGWTNRMGRVLEPDDSSRAESSGTGR
jgi:glycosyltransferase involved in cell wall biosynthesis